MYKTKKLKDCATIIAGQSPESKYYNTVGDGIPFFQGKADFGELYPTVRIYCSQPTKIAEKDDILLSVRAPVGPTNLSPGRVCIGRGLSAIRPSSDINLRYLLYYFRFFEAQLSAKGTGTTFKAITQATIKNLDVPVPPLPDQEHIVSRIEELISQLDASVAELKTAKERLRVYRQAVLKEAFEKVKVHIPFGKIIDARLGKMLDKEKNTGNYRKYLRNINVRWFSFDLSDLLEMRIEDDEIEKYSVSHNDLIICEGGEPGRCAVWDKQDSIFYQKALHRVRFLDNSNPKFYMYYLWFSAQTGQLCRYFTGTGIKHLTGQSLSKVVVPKTDRPTQDSIVAEIESRLSVCDSIENTVDTALQQAEALRQSILKKAFEGGLKMAVTVGNRVQSMIDHMEKGELDLALSDICIALDITSQKYYERPSSSRTTYKNFIKENIWMIVTTGMGNLIAESIKLPFHHPEIESDTEGYCTLEQIVYHVMRCGLVHGTGENSKIVWNSLVPLALDKDGNLNLSPSFIWGLALAVITCEVNRDERVNDTCWISMVTFKYLINDLWGKRDNVKTMIKSAYNVTIEEGAHQNA